MHSCITRYRYKFMLILEGCTGAQQTKIISPWRKRQHTSHSPSKNFFLCWLDSASESNPIEKYNGNYVCIPVKPIFLYGSADSCSLHYFQLICRSKLFCLSEGEYLNLGKKMGMFNKIALLFFKLVSSYFPRQQTTYICSSAKVYLSEANIK